MKINVSMIKDPINYHEDTVLQIMRRRKKGMYLTFNPKSMV